jgi:hypothetical protein
LQSELVEQMLLLHVNVGLFLDERVGAAVSLLIVFDESGGSWRKAIAIIFRSELCSVIRICWEFMITTPFAPILDASSAIAFIAKSMSSCSVGCLGGEAILSIAPTMSYGSGCLYSAIPRAYIFPMIL